MQRAIALSGNSAPGPNGMPYSAWRRLGALAVDVLHEAFQDCCAVDALARLAQDYPSFNESLLIFLPKKAAGQTEQGQDLFEPGGVRPLNITNTANRLLASACRLAVGPALAERVAQLQK
eukprot:4080682-Pyramimonas_sp.AAC.1